MAIGNVVERSGYVYVYDEAGRQRAAIPINYSEPDSGLKGYTGSTVNVQRGSYIYSFDARGNKVGTPRPVSMR